MARITVEDCIDKFPSRFELVLVASNRARKLHSGENPTVEIDNDKNTVIALREIAEETLSSEQLKNNLIEEYQTTTFAEDEDINELEDNTDENQSVKDQDEEIQSQEEMNDNIMQSVEELSETSSTNIENSLEENGEKDS